MNKIFLIAIVLIAIAFTGCKKETLSVNEQEVDLKAAQLTRILWYDDGTNFGCNPRFQGDCFPIEIIVVGLPILRQGSEQNSYFKNLILETTPTTKGDALVIEKLNDGTYTVEVKYNPNDNIYYILVLDQSGNIVSVRPYNLV